MPHDLDTRRRAIARAFRAAARGDDRPARNDMAELKQTVDGLQQRVEELAKQLEELRGPRDVAMLDRLPIIPPPPEDEAPPGRVAVPPVTPAKISNQAFDVLLGSVSERVADTRIA
jgi:hypothetical protein